MDPLLTYNSNHPHYGKMIGHITAMETGRMPNGVLKKDEAKSIIMVLNATTIPDRDKKTLLELNIKSMSGIARSLIRTHNIKPPKFNNDMKTYRKRK